MKIAAITECICLEHKRFSPWILHKEFLSQHGFEISSYEAADNAPWKQPWDAMIYQAWQAWGNPRFKPDKIMKAFGKYATYRAMFPSTIQIVCNHSDMSRYPLATPYWRVNDPILFRNPSYDRSELFPFPAESIWPYEISYSGTYGSPCFASTDQLVYDAGLICSPSDSTGRRRAVAQAVAKIGYGVCLEEIGKNFVHPNDYNKIMGQCRIIVCPQGWGGGSQRHWDAWKSKKPVLTDSECAAIEMIPGMQLKENEHYLVYKSPEEIPDIVSDWSKPSRADDLRKIAENGHQASLRPQEEHILNFFKSLKPAS